MFKTLAIIGTAGRGEDKNKLTLDHWNIMIAIAEEVAAKEKALDLVSGGAAWADHVAVELHLKQPGRYPLKLWLPEKESDLIVAQRYHAEFSKVIGRNTWSEILRLERQHYKGFKERNTKVADMGDVFLAMTFGNGAEVKDGGTKDTVDKMIKNGARGYHYNLNTFKLYEI